MPSANNVKQTVLTRQGLLQGSQEEILSKHLLHCLETLWLTQPFSSTVESIPHFFAFFLGGGGKYSVCGIGCFMGIVFRRIFYYTLYSIIPEEKVEKV
jgi:hypothetical protein